MIKNPTKQCFVCDKISPFFQQRIENFLGAFFASVNLKKGKLIKIHQIIYIKNEKTNDASHR
jgi:hypothetical protein